MDDGTPAGLRTTDINDSQTDRTLSEEKLLPISEVQREEIKSSGLEESQLSVCSRTWKTNRSPRLLKRGHICRNTAPQSLLVWFWMSRNKRGNNNQEITVGETEVLLKSMNKMPMRLSSSVCSLQPAGVNLVGGELRCSKAAARPV